MNQNERIVIKSRRDPCKIFKKMMQLLMVMMQLFLLTRKMMQLHSLATLRKSKARIFTPGTDLNQVRLDSSTS